MAQVTVSDDAARIRQFTGQSSSLICDMLKMRVGRTDLGVALHLARAWYLVAMGN